MAKSNKEKQESLDFEEKVSVQSQMDIGDIKDDLKEYMKARIDSEVSKAVEKANKKLIHHKNLIIIKRDITILLLIIMCAALIYNLYNVSNINIDITKDKKIESENVKEKKDVTDSSLEDKVKEHGFLLDDISLDEDSTYIKDFYEGNLTEEIKMYFALNKMDEEKISNEDGTVYIDESDLKESYNLLFDTEFEAKPFKYNELNFKHLSSKGLFWADGEFKKQDSDIHKEIINIEEKDDSITILTVEGIINDKKLYNILTKKEIKNFDGSLKDYKETLTQVSYTFDKVDDEYKLSKIEIK